MSAISVIVFKMYYRKIHCLTSEFHVKFHAKNYGALLGSKLIMQTFLYNYFRIATLVARLIDNEASFDIFCENLLLSAGFMACKCFSLPLLSNCDSSRG